MSYIKDLLATKVAEVKAKAKAITICIVTANVRKNCPKAAWDLYEQDGLNDLNTATHSRLKEIWDRGKYVDTSEMVKYISKKTGYPLCIAAACEAAHDNALADLGLMDLGEPDEEEES